MNAEDYKTVKVPQWVYDNAIAVRGDLVRQGLDSVPAELLEPPQCPRCGSEVDYLRVEYEQLDCGSCGYKQRSMSASSNTGKGIGIGILLGLGIAAIASAMSASSSGGAQIRSAPAKKRSAKKKRAAKSGARKR